MCTEKPDHQLLSGIFAFITLFFLIITTWLAGGPEFRFRSVAELPNPLIDNQYPPVWEIRGPFGNIDIRPGNITLNRVTDGDCAVLVPVNIAGLAADSVLRLQADFLVEGERDVQRRVHYMHLYLLFYKNGESNGVISLRPAMPEHRNKAIYRVLRIPAGSDGMNLVMQCGQAEDSYRLGNLRIERVEHSWPYKVTLAALLLFWSAIGLTTAWWLVRRVSWKVHLPLAAGVCALAIGISVSKVYFVQLLDPLHTLLVGWIPILRILSLDTWFKIGHLGFFFTIALILFFNHRRLQVSALRLFASLVVLAFATEAWQMHFIGRWSRLNDVLIDLTGVLLAYVAVLLCNLLQKKSAAVKRQG